MKSIRRFTLVELLAVIALIAILSGIGFGAYSYARGKAKESATEAMMKQIEAGLESFHARFGYYPPTDGEFKPIIFKFDTDGTPDYIDFGGTGGKLTLHKGTSMSKKERMENEQIESFTKVMDMEVVKNNIDDDGRITDSWGGKIYYRSPGTFKAGSFDLISAGPDGVFSKEQKDTPAGLTTLTNFRELSGEHVCDDLFTF